MGTGVDILQIAGLTHTQERSPSRNTQERSPSQNTQERSPSKNTQERSPSQNTQERSYSQHVTPTGRISSAAEKVTNLTNRGGVLMRITSKNPEKLEPIPSLPIHNALLGFLDWLDDIKPCVVIGHNVVFDKRHIIHHLSKEKLLSNFDDKVVGFIDTLPLYRAVYPNLRKIRVQVIPRQYFSKSCLV